MSNLQKHVKEQVERRQTMTAYDIYLKVSEASCGVRRNEKRAPRGT